jgi:ABC-type bacteriocin/lantibiotic exporter with double-glycine peptidase domain
MWPERTVRRARSEPTHPTAQEIPLADLENPCGPVCLSLISRIHGRPVSLKKASALVSPDSLGRTSVSKLVKALIEIGLYAKAVRLPIARFAELRAPAILHWGGNHFVVAARNEAGEMMMFDPPRNPVVIDRETLARSFTEVVILVAIDEAKLESQLRDIGLHASIRESADRL